MKRNSKASKEGFVLLTALVITLAIGIVAISLIRLTLQEFRLSMRSAAYTKALHAAESGATLACAEFCKEITSDSDAWSGWTTSGTLKTITLDLTNASGAVISSYTVSVDPDSGGEPGAASAGSDTYNITSTGSADLAGENIGRTVRIAVQKNEDDSAFFKYGILSKASLRMGGSVAANSYDSTDTEKSTGGQYDPAKATRKATIATLSTETPAFRAEGGPDLSGIGAISVGEGGTIEIKPWILEHFSGTLSSNATQEIKDVEVPISQEASASIDTAPWRNRYQTINVNGTQDLSLKSLKVVSDGSLTITGAGKLRIYVDDKMTVSGSGKITISPSPSTADLKVEFYVNDTVNIAGSGLLNRTHQASACSIWATENCKSVTVTGNAGYIGTIYAPYSDVDLHGSSFAAGAFLGGSIAFTGNTRFYIDESLIGKPTGTTEFLKPYTLKHWVEL